MTNYIMSTGDGPQITVSFKPEAGKNFVKVSMHCPYDEKTTAIYLTPDEAAHFATLLVRQAKDVNEVDK